MFFWRWTSTERACTEGPAADRWRGPALRFPRYMPQTALVRSWEIPPRAYVAFTRQERDWILSEMELGIGQRFRAVVLSTTLPFLPDFSAKKAGIFCAYWPRPEVVVPPQKLCG